VSRPPGRRLLGWLTSLGAVLSAAGAVMYVLPGPGCLCSARACFCCSLQRFFDSSVGSGDDPGTTEARSPTAAAGPATAYSGPGGRSGSTVRAARLAGGVVGPDCGGWGGRVVRGVGGPSARCEPGSSAARRAVVRCVDLAGSPPGCAAACACGACCTWSRIPSHSDTSGARRLSPFRTLAVSISPGVVCR